MGETINSSNNIMDECYGKQIDYYNQFPNSSRVIEDLIERLEKAESNNEKYKKYLFNELKDFEISNCSGEWHTDNDSGGWWEDAKLSVKIDKNNEKIIIDILETIEYQWVINPNDSNYYKLKQYDYENIEKITYETQSMLYDSETQLVNINKCSISGPASDWDERGGPEPDGLPKFYWFRFKNEKKSYNASRRQIDYIRIPEKAKCCNNFKILLNLTQFNEYY